MQEPHTTLPECFEKIRLIIAVTTGSKLNEILPHFNLVADLGLNLSLDLPEIINTLNHEYRAEEINLSSEEIKQELKVNEPTVLELAKIVQEKRELG